MDTNQQHKDHNNTKPIWQTIVLCNTPCFKLKSKKPAKNSISPIVIPKKRQRNSQSKTFSQHEKTRFKHTSIYTQVQRGKPKEPQRTQALHDPNERTATPQNDSKQH
jgi:hypothetical protein